MGGGGPMAGGGASLQTPGCTAAASLHMRLGGGDLLTGSDFAMNRESRGGILSFWSRGAQSRFSGREGALSLGGDVRTTMFGADYARGPVVAGLSLSNSRGLGEYAGASAGQVASSVTGLYPWLGYKMTERVTVWGVAGYGAGGLLLTPDSGQALESGMSMAMAAAGTRGELVAGGASGFELAFKADALWVGTSIAGVDGPEGRLNATEAAVTRLRTGLEGSRAFTLAGRLSLKPSVEVGLRHDGGDAETGAGMDVGGGLVVSDSSTGLAVDLRVQMLVMHQAEGFRERGMAVSLSYNPTPSTPLGLVARVAPSWGGQATSGAEALWGRETMGGISPGGVASGSRLDGEIGYGLPVGEPLRGHAAGRLLRVGVRPGLPGRLRPRGARSREPELRAGGRRAAAREPAAGRHLQPRARPGLARLVGRGEESLRGVQYLADGHHVDDAGNLIPCSHVDLREPGEQTPITTLQKASPKRYAHGELSSKPVNLVFSAYQGLPTTDRPRAPEPDPRNPEALTANRQRASAGQYDPETCACYQRHCQPWPSD